MNKLRILGAALLVMIASQSFGQAQFALGVKGGLNFAKFDANDAGGSIKNKTGFHGGAFALIKLTKIGIQPELIYSQQGSKLKLNGQDLESNFSYVNIPVMLKFYLIAGLNLQVGPQFGFLAGAKSDGYDVAAQQFYKDRDVKSLYKKSDVTVGLGAGWDLPFGLTVDARYNLGLSKIDDDAAAAAAKNQVFQLSLGYKLIKFGK
ncbi:porin family protein [Pseudochryseolinea flava]|uniref:PorT family protein n=1 Tax=Pseudochryseolinea flava TaxID=2059302 RepID=A0A364XVJ3_9BACT|nr:porin family protein [Pseudochryseolinea flava]RAV98128.1 PorT family protein [Pseudochryseolinea flava]